MTAGTGNPYGSPGLSRTSSMASVGAFRHTGNATSVNVGVDECSTIKKNGPVTDVSNTGDPRYLNTWIAEVVIAHPNGDLIRKYNAQQKRLEEVC